MNEPTQDMYDEKLARRVFYVIKDYVNRRARDKKDREISEAKEKVAKDAFLAMRSRRDEDFVEYFTGSICSVPHHLPEEEYLAVSEALIEAPETVKNLAMLALSAHSYSWTPSDKAESSTDSE